MVWSSYCAVLKTVTNSYLSGSLLIEFHILILAIISQGANYLASPAQWLNIAPNKEVIKDCWLWREMIFPGPSLFLLLADQPMMQGAIGVFGHSRSGTKRSVLSLLKMAWRKCSCMLWQFFLTRIHISTLHFKIPLLYWPTEKWEDQIAPLLLKLSETLVVFSDFAAVSTLAVVEWCYIFPPWASP